MKNTGILQKFVLKIIDPLLTTCNTSILFKCIVFLNIWENVSAANALQTEIHARLYCPFVKICNDRVIIFLFNIFNSPYAHDHFCLVSQCH